MKITFLGGVEEVTGSRYLVEHQDTKLLVDCGLFQGTKELTKHNWDPFPVEPKSIKAVILTHAHIDHTGYLPVLVKNGFKGKIYCSKATFALCKILLADSAAIFEEDAAEENLPPLYTQKDADKALQRFQPIDYGYELQLGDSLTATLTASGHILGASFVKLSDGKNILTFSGDLGRPHPLIMKAPPHVEQTDFLVLESTYGNRRHEEGDVIQQLGEIVNKTIKKGGVIIIPAFAIGRAQIIIYALYQLRQKKVIPEIPIFLDSPMAINVTNLFCRFKDEHTLSPLVCDDIFGIATYTRKVEKSKKLDQLKHPAIILAGSGMATGGRVLFHLQHFISDAKNTILFVGYQAKGTLGRELIEGAKQVSIYNKMYTVNAEIKKLNMLSAHADYNEILQWLEYFNKAPKKVFITHGELEVAQSLQKKIEDQFGWSVEVPNYLDSFELD